MDKIKKSNQVKEIDFAYIVKHCDQSNHEIPHSFDKIEWKIGETYKIRIGNIYDPSKFWIVHYEQELTVFHNFINEFYNKRGEDYHMPKEVIKRNRYCAVCTDGNYYRGLIVNIPNSTHVDVKVVVFLFDFGFTATVSVEDMYYLYEKLYNVPRFAIRACLPGVEPIDSDTWTSKTVEKFSELTMGKVLLCVLETMNVEMRIAFIRIGEMTPYNEIKEVSNTLLEEKLAKVSSGRRHKIKKSKGKLITTVNYPFLFPSHQALESGLMPSTCYEAEMIKQCPLPASILYRPYFKHQSS